MNIAITTFELKDILDKHFWNNKDIAYTIDYNEPAELWKARHGINNEVIWTYKSKEDLYKKYPWVSATLRL